MKTRILTGVVAGSLMLTVLLLPWSWLLSLATSVIAAIAVYEVFSVTGMLRYRGLESVAVVFAAIAPFFSRMAERAVIVTAVAYVLLLVLIVVLYRTDVSIKRMAVVFSLSTFISLALSCMSYLRTVPATRDSDGLFYVILAMLMAWGADTGAYFVGTFFGKHKLCPKLSPKKTVEGLFGGIVTSVLVSVLAAVCYQALVPQEITVSYVGLLLLALLCAPLSVVGDLFASLIKRVCGAKDYGHIFPGHGGMMDRFDSLLFVFPLVYAVARVSPLV